MPEATVGRVVWYRHEQTGMDFPAIVTCTPDSWRDHDHWMNLLEGDQNLQSVPQPTEGTVHLHVLLPLSSYESMQRFVSYSEEPTPATWRWPETRNKEPIAREAPSE